MSNIWRQGDLIAPEDAIKLQLTKSEHHSYRLLVISHSCDIAREEAVEPHVELLLTTVVQDFQATDCNGHSIRKLHLPAQGAENIEWLELCITERQVIQKFKLLAEKPWAERTINRDGIRILRRWLAQRYARSEFPDAFCTWLTTSGVGQQFKRLAKRFSDALVGFYFDLDDDSERQDADDPYVVDIYLVYDSKDASHASLAQEAANQLKGIFQTKCQQAGRWRWIELINCEAISDEAFSLRAANTFRRWRFEHLSVAGEPIDGSE